ncbi:MAG: PEP-CTERM sorting domain-containing protein [Kiritimatiellae bacterium]|nr:PEP-CTERM sorting domain-containing protein [Kiritimatiellia bacterium]
MRRLARIAAIWVIVAHAAIPGRADIILNWLDTPIDVSTDTSPVYYSLDLSGSGFVDFTFAASVASVSVRNEGNNRYLIFPSPPPNIGGGIEPLSEGFEIGSNSVSEELEWFGHETSFASLGIWLSTGTSGRFVGQHAYMGIEFDIDGATHYGWINLRVGELGPGVEIYGWAYESTPNTPILAGAIPEPSTLLLLLGGTTLLLGRRQKRRFR